ncbi:hypothetical protein Ami103574_10830 [Aminipila butyrica]|uniref:Uncharacterized protein n=1 Tax=Aminipila butyrica TaxID=433296 RepID=A0A858BV10_9FIRM|nr:hypothetical protein [Aminipila butyrica]QIB69783.1 hypothetical protein Ami103574_10830 [Aminipila butyrica]
METLDILKVLMSGKKGSKLPQANEGNSIWDALPIKGLKNGILLTKYDYIAFMEVMPINLKLRSDREQNYVMEKYEELLKKIRVPFYMTTISKKADLKEHISYVEKLVETEEVEAVREMTLEYRDFVKEAARKETVKKRFIVAIPYQQVKGIEAPFDEAESWLHQICSDYEDAMQECGNEIKVSWDNQFTAQILFELLNVKSSERERIPRLES